MRHKKAKSGPVQAAVLAISMICCGCHAYLAPHQSLPVQPADPPPVSDVPRELNMVSLPPYVIEPPDILNILSQRTVPKSPHFIETFDVLAIRAATALPTDPIAGTYVVDPEGKVNLGPSYGKVAVKGLTLDEAQTRVVMHLRRVSTISDVSMSLAFTTGVQPIQGPHLVAPDGTANLGTYGKVYVAGMTIPQAKQAIEERLTHFLENPEVMVDIAQYNSKTYYIVLQGAGLGDRIRRLPVTGNETVLDAISQVGGLTQLSSKRIWISRPAPNGVGCQQILEVNWQDITRGAITATNYQILPGDRLFVAQDPLIAADSFITKVTRPFERIFGFTLLGTQAILRIDQFRNPFFAFR